MHLVVFDDGEFFTQFDTDGTEASIEHAKNRLFAAVKATDRFDLDSFTFQLQETSEYVGSWDFDYGLYKPVKEDYEIQVIDIDSEKTLWEGKARDWANSSSQFDGGYNIIGGYCKPYSEIGSSEI